MSWIRAVVVTLLIAACGDDGAPIVPPGLDAVDVDAGVPLCKTPANPTWWTPAPGETKNWDIQLSSEFDIATARTMYELELFDVVPVPMMIDYADGDPVTVPAGALAGAIAELHGRTPRAVVVCHVAPATIDLDEPDARKFPGFKTEPPDAPVPPEATSVIGWSTQDPFNPKQRYLDLRAGERGRWTPIMFKRFGLAKAIGCDAIEVDRVDIFKKTTGFTLVETEVSAFIGQLSDEIHTHSLSAGLRDGFNTAGELPALAACYDWGMQNRCAEFNDCYRIGAFGDLGKAMFGLDIRAPDRNNYGIDPALACPRYLPNGTDGIVKAEQLDASFRHGCEL
ncbi:MAG: endo alpha-1,4 polygalactosaminidase [Kofleriaceae bacterium]